MKIYNKIVIDSDGYILGEDSFEYNGPIAECKGGGTSATTAFPNYIQNIHKDWIYGGDTADADEPRDRMGRSMVDTMTEAIFTVGAELLDNASFADDAGSLAGWTVGANWSQDVDRLRANRVAGSNVTAISQTILTNGDTYLAVVAFSGLTAFDFVMSLGDPADVGTPTLHIRTTNIFGFVGKATGTLFAITAGKGAAGTVDWVSVKKLTEASPYTALTAYDPDASDTNTSGSPLNDMQIRHDVLDTHISNLVETTDWDTIVDKVFAPTATLSSLFPTYALDTRVTAIGAIDLTEAEDAALSSSAKGLAAATLLADSTAAPHTDSLANIELLQAQADAAIKSDAEAILTAAAANALTALTTRQAQIDTEIKADTAGEIDAVTANALVNVALQMTAITAEAIADATVAFETNAHAKSKTITANLDTLAKAAAVLDSDSIIGTINTTVMSKMKDMIASAVTAAITAVNATPLQDMIDAFEQRRTGQHFRSVSRLAGPLADAGAINSSAYIFAMAALESDFSREVSQFDAEAVFKVYTQALDIFGQAFNSTFDGYLKLYSTEFTGYIGLYVEGLKEYLSTYHVTLGKEIDSNDKMIQGELSIYQALSTKYHDSADSLSGSELSSYNSMMSNYNNIALALSNSYLQAALGYNDQAMATFRQLAASHISAEVQSEMGIRQQKSAWFMEGVRQMTATFMQKGSLEAQAVGLQTDLSRIKMVALKEQDDLDATYDVNDALWDLKVYQYGANMLGAPSGGAALIPETPSSMSSAIGGAVSGAGTGGQIGASFGAPGALAGAGIGALLGGVAGALE